MAQSGKLLPNLDQNSTKILNVTVLQRMDPYIEEILITAAHVTFYEFNVDLNQWSRKDVEGSLFVVKRNTLPRFQFIVMNRRNTENLVENLLGDFEFELQVPYLVYRNAAQEVNGIWFYNSRECEDVANLFTRILGAYSKVPPKPKVNKSEFEELEAVPTSAVIEGPLGPPFTTSSSTDVPEDTSFVNYFGTAMNLGQNTSNSVNSVQPYHNSTTVPLPSRVAPSPVHNGPTLHSPSLAPSAPPMPLHDNPDPANSSNRVTNLIKPLSFFTPSSSSSSLMPQPISSSVPVTALQPPINVQRNYGIPLLQPFPPPTPPPSLTPSSTSAPNYGPLIREKVRDALLMLDQMESGDEVVEVSGTSKKNDPWPMKNTEYFIDLMEEVKKGNRVATTFTTQSWSLILTKLIEKTRYTYTHDQLKNKYNFLREEYRCCKMLCEQSGMTRDPTTNMFCASEELWQRLFMVNKFAKRFKKKGCIYYDKLCTIFGDTTVTSANSHPSTKLPSDSEDDVVKVEETQEEKVPKNAQTRRRRKRQGGSLNNKPSTSFEGLGAEAKKRTEARKRTEAVKMLKKMTEVKMLNNKPSTSFKGLGAEAKKKTEAKKRTEAEAVKMLKKRTETETVKKLTSTLSGDSCIMGGVGVGESLGGIREIDSIKPALDCLEKLDVHGPVYGKAFIKIREDPIWREMFMSISDARKVDVVMSLI